MIEAIALAVLATLLVGALGTLAAAVLARNRLEWGTFAAPLVSVVAIGGGVLVGARVMLFDSARTRELTFIVLACMIVALILGALLAHRVARVEQERRAEAQRRELVSHLSHDLRTPLAGIRAMSEALADGVGEQRDTYPRQILESIDRAISMTDTMLAISTMDVNTGPRDVVDVTDVVSDAVGGMYPQAAAREIRLEGGGSGPLIVTARASDLLRAVENLLVNAVRHTARGGTVRVRATPVERGRMVEVAVRDECGGVDPHTAAHMCEALWRGDAARQTTAGAGLGLTIVQATAQAHGGRMGVRNVEGGCEIWFQISATR